MLDELSRRIELLLPVSPDDVKARESGFLSSTEAALLAGTRLTLATARELIQEHALLRRTVVESVEEAPVSPFGTRSYRALARDGQGVIYCHADGRYRGQSFYVRKGIGWLYERVLLGATSRLGLPISNEEMMDGTGYPTSLFEGGYIEWSPQTDVARAVVHTSRGDQVMVERKL